MFLSGVNLFFANVCKQYPLRKLTSVRVFMIVNVQRMYTLFITCKLHSNANTIIKSSLRHRRNLTLNSNTYETAPVSLFWGRQRTQRINGNAFQVSL